MRRIDDLGAVRNGIVGGPVGVSRGGHNVVAGSIMNLEAEFYASLVVDGDVVIGRLISIAKKHLIVAGIRGGMSVVRRLIQGPYMMIVVLDLPGRWLD